MRKLLIIILFITAFIAQVAGAFLESLDKQEQST
jgi:hypothetical protein